MNADARQPQAGQQKFNSTSSLYIDSTISKPCIDEIIFCVAIAIHDRVQEGEERRAQALLTSIFLGRLVTNQMCANGTRNWVLWSRNSGEQTLSIVPKAAAATIKSDK